LRYKFIVVSERVNYLAVVVVTPIALCRIGNTLDHFCHALLAGATHFQLRTDALTSSKLYGVSWLALLAIKSKEAGHNDGGRWEKHIEGKLVGWLADFNIGGGSEAPTMSAPKSLMGPALGL
jgi:hypothetical protein